MAHENPSLRPAPQDDTSAAPPLFRRFPRLAEHIAWLPLATLPTPVQPLAIPGVDADLWIKRDDLSGERYGGNKVRKLEFLIAEARRRGATRLVTAGATGSHHALATTVYGRAAGFDVSLVLFPQSRTPHVARILLQDHLLGAELRWAPAMEAIPLAVYAARWAHRHERVHVIPPGGSDAIGTLGYVSAALELAAQFEAGDAPCPDAIHVAAGTMGTLAGIAIGLAIAGVETRVIGTRITAPIVTNERALHRLVARTSALLTAAGAVVPPVERVLRDVSLEHGFIGAGYGKETSAGRDAEAAFRDTGIELDVTYTAKAAAELLTARGGVHLFWQTLSAVEPFQAIPDEAIDGLPRRFRDYLERGRGRVQTPRSH